MFQKQRSIDVVSPAVPAAPRRRPPPILLAALLPLAACTRASAPIPLSRALAEIQRELADAGAVSAVGTDPSRFAAAALAAQCAASAPDPEIPVLAHDLTLDLSGSFSATGGFEVSPLPATPASLSLGATRGQTQEIALPLTFVALSELPAVVTAQRLLPLAALPDADRAAETAPILLQRDALRARITALIAAWTPARCAAGTGPAPGLVHPDARPASPGS
ncbi:MAG: hypothetical protein INR65_14845 [Gluconacetobacter diazotrophicus]|nr:hypothetical protein [Gluconacetobacter diazotrophicus]